MSDSARYLKCKTSSEQHVEGGGEEEICSPLESVLFRGVEGKKLLLEVEKQQQQLRALQKQKQT